MEKGDHYPTIDLICRVCEIFHVSTAWMLLGVGNIYESADINASIASLEERMQMIEQQIEVLKKAAKGAKK